MANQSRKNMLKKNYGKRCMLCTEKKCDNELTFHHLKPKSYGGKSTMDNGVLLCRDCHDKIHKYDFLSSEYFDLTLKMLNNKVKYNKEKVMKIS